MSKIRVKDIKLKSCIMCESDKVKLTYLDNARYRVECSECGQYLEFNALSEMAAKVMWNRTFRNEYVSNEWIPCSYRLPTEDECIKQRK